MAKIPFTLDTWLKDKSQKIETRSGKNVRIVCWDKIGVPIIALVGDAEDIVTYNRDGTTGQQMQLPSDLFIITPEPELTEFEKAVGDVIYAGCDIEGMLESNPVKQNVREASAKLLAIAREEIVKQGYVIEKKAFHDAVEKVDPEVKKEVSENIDLADFIQNLGERYPEVSFKKLTRIAKAAYDYGKKEALKDLPRWENAKIPPTDIAKVWIDALDSFWLQHKNKEILVQSLEKLPGFKEDEK